MPSTMPLTITLGRQLGSGGSYVGRQVAQRLGYAYLDSQILRQAAEELDMDEAELRDRDGRLQTFWEKLVAVLTVGWPDGVYVPPPHMISDELLVETQQRLISDLAVKGPCVFLGRGAFHFLRGKVPLLNVFVHAPIGFRVERVMSVYHAQSEDEAIKMIERSDHERRRFIRTFTGVEWLDVRNYHLSIDSGIVDFGTAVDMIASLAERVPRGKAWSWVNEPV
jgi:cytidylate kinase